MSSFANNLSTSQTQYRDLFQGLWGQAKARADALRDSYRLLQSQPGGLNTTTAESIARDLAQTEAQMLIFRDNFVAGFQQRERTLRIKLANAQDLFHISQIDAQLATIADAYVGLDAASLGWVPPANANYAANGKIFNNTSGEEINDLSTVTGVIKEVVIDPVRNLAAK